MSNLLDSLRSPPPEVSTDQALSIALSEFNLSGSAKYLGGERDCNFLIENPDSSESHILLKIANPAESDHILDMQCCALQHIAYYNKGLAIPRLIKTTGAENWATCVVGNGQSLRIRALSYLPGNSIDQEVEDSGLTKNLGRSMAELNIALRGFFHPSAQHPLAWNIQHLDQLSGLVQYITDPTQKELVSKTLDRFKDSVKPHLAKCRSQIIHNDISFHNTVVSEHDPTLVSGIFDFGDMVFAPVIQDLANTAAEIPAGSKNPLARSAEIIAGFHDTLPLENTELELLPDLISARLALCILIDAWSTSVNSWQDERDHLDGWHEKSVNALDIIHQCAPGHFENLIRSTCSLDTINIPKQAKPSTPKRKNTQWQRREKYLGNANYYAYDEPLHLVRGEGVWLYDCDDNRFLDAYNNVPHAGHCHPVIVEAVARQTATLNTNTRYVCDIVSEYAERISATLPGGLDACYFVSSGSEANDLAWRLGTSWTGNDGGLILEHAYHGITEATYALSPAEFKFDDLSQNQLYEHIETIIPPNDYRGEWKRLDKNRGQRYAQQITQSINNLATRGIKPAAFFSRYDYEF